MREVKPVLTPLLAVSRRNGKQHKWNDIRCGWYNSWWHYRDGGWSAWHDAWHNGLRDEDTGTAGSS